MATVDDGGVSTILPLHVVALLLGTFAEVRGVGVEACAHNEQEIVLTWAESIMEDTELIHRSAALDDESILPPDLLRKVNDFAEIIKHNLLPDVRDGELVLVSAFRVHLRQNMLADIANLN